MLFSLDVAPDRTSALNPIDIELVKAIQVILSQSA